MISLHARLRIVYPEGGVEARIPATHAQGESD
jgi:hypothetical protein